ncbi:MAG: bifunctional 4-hydroxy-2-oxoglutarate aldolase/2-dehydro-3-deoxy-phosphogluconate aldolase [Candidatus Omnitrophota bacterium]
MSIPERQSLCATVTKKKITVNFMRAWWERMCNKMDVLEFKKLPIMGILRDVELGAIEPLVDTIVSAGLGTIEITMNSNNAAELIRKAVNISKQRLIVGAGTVLNLDSLKSALDSGATFIVLPVFVKEVVEYCVKNKVPVFPGAFTPQEIYRAWSIGAAMVKVFPAKFLGPEYFKEIKGPFKDIELLACGGVTPENMAAYFLNGASAVSFGASVFKKEWLIEKDFVSIGKYIKVYLQAFSCIQK